MNPDPQVYATQNSMQKQDAKVLLEKFIPMMKWNIDNDTLMDIGCGPGDTTLQLILPLFPEVKSVIAIDNLPSMIKFAETQNAHPKIKYSVADISDESTLREWKGKITTVVSNHCFHMLEDKQTGFRNLFNLLREDGKALLLLSISPFWDFRTDVINSPKWKEYLQDTKPCSHRSRVKDHGSQYYRDMLGEMGFSVLACEEERRNHSYENDDRAKEAIASRCNFSDRIPEHLKEEFKDDLLKIFLKYNSRDAEGKPQLQYSTLSLYLQKPLKI